VSSDRLVPQRIHPTRSAILEISEQNYHEIEIINKKKGSLISKKESDEEMVSATSHPAAATTGVPAPQNAPLDERGLSS